MSAEQSQHSDDAFSATTEYLTEDRQPLSARVWRRLKSPETTADLLLATKAVIAGTSAWAISVGVLGTEVAFMARGRRCLPCTPPCTGHFRAAPKRRSPRQSAWAWHLSS